MGGERDKRTYVIIGAAMEVHRVLGPGLLEAVYQEALEMELDLRGIRYAAQPKLEIEYKGRRLRAYYVPDFVISESIVVEIKAESRITNAAEAQILNSLKCAHLEVGLVINFGSLSLQWRRFVA